MKNALLFALALVLGSITLNPAASAATLRLEITANVEMDGIAIRLNGADRGVWSTYGSDSESDLEAPAGRVARLSWKVPKDGHLYANDMVCDDKVTKLKASATSFRIKVPADGITCKLYLVQPHALEPVTPPPGVEPHFNMKSGQTPSSRGRTWERCPEDTIPGVLGATDHPGSRDFQTRIDERRAVELLPVRTANGAFYPIAGRTPVKGIASVWCLPPEEIRTAMRPPDTRYRVGERIELRHHGHHAADIGGLPDPLRRFRVAGGVTGYAQGLVEDGPSAYGTLATGTIWFRMFDSNAWWWEITADTGWTTLDDANLWTIGGFTGPSVMFGTLAQLSAGFRTILAFDDIEDKSKFFGGEVALTFWITDSFGIRAAGMFGTTGREVADFGPKLMAPAGYTGETQTGGTSVDYFMGGGGNVTVMFRL